MSLSSSEKELLHFQLTQAFRPSIPINRNDLFKGREGLLKDVLAVLNQDGAHAVIFGERGVGKTSLANMIALDTRFTGMIPLVVSHITCQKYLTSTELWCEVLKEIEWKCEEKKIRLGKTAKRELENARSTNKITPGDLNRLTRALSDSLKLIVILDEFDLLEDSDARLEIAETIKLLSDRNAPVTVVIVGVADDIEALVNDHRSIERCICQIKLMRMKKSEIGKIIEHGLQKCSMSIERSVLKELSSIAKGLPHYAHLLGLYTASHTITRGEKAVLRGDIEHGVARALENSIASIESAYQKAVTSVRKDAKYREILLACAITKCDEFGFFSATDVVSPLSKILNVPAKVEAFGRHLHGFCTEERGEILKTASLSGKRPRFRFSNPLMEPFVLLKGLSSKQISTQDIPSDANENDEPESTSQLELF